MGAQESRKCDSQLLLGLLKSSEGRWLVTIGNQHHLDNLVVVIFVSSKEVCVNPKKLYVVLKYVVLEW